MFDIGFSEVLLIFVIALVVLGPEKLPRAASQVGRWVGRARAMARQFKEQLEEEVNLENVRKAHKEAAAKEETASKDTASGGGTATGEGASAAGATDAGAAGAAAAGGGHRASSAAGDAPQAGTYPQDGSQSDAASPTASTGATYSGPDPADFRADTFSHAHPTNEYGANPLTANGAPPDEPSLLAGHASVSPSPGSTSESNASSPNAAPSAPLTAEAGISSDNTDRTDSTEAYAPATTLTPTLPASEPLREPVPATTILSDHHGHS
jgi:sec-independent protein translocase protein TatB